MATETLMHNTQPLGALLGDASDIIFDNGGTNLTSDNVEDAIKELTDADNIQYDNNTSVKNKIDSKVGDWIYLGEKTGTAEHSLPTGWKELLLQVNVNSGNLVTYHIYNVQTDNYTNTSLGNYGTSYAVGQLSRTKAKISTVNWAGQDVTSSAKLYAYYR